MTQDRCIYLASASPRRQQLLQQIGIDHRVIPAEIDETVQNHETVADYVSRLAIAKVMAGWCWLISNGVEQAARSTGLVMGADTSIALGTQIFGKPENRQHGLQMLSALSGQRHKVYSAVALVNQIEYNSLSQDAPVSGQVKNSWQARPEWERIVRVNVTEVSMRPMQRTDIEAYWDCGEPQGKAGAYAIQGRGAVFIEQIQGSYSGVMGLPLFETAELLRHHGIDVL